jgi:hypothetical protein
VDKMDKRCLLTALFILASAPGSSAAQDSSALTRVTAALDRIPARLTDGFSEEVEESFIAMLNTLHQHPALAAQLLVDRLTPTSPGAHSDHPAVVWYIRALRSLTGLDFTAPSAAHLSDSVIANLLPDSAKYFHFFRYQMGWDVTWLAPHDAQVAIIRKWRAWYAKEGTRFKYVNDPDREHWYF